MTDQKQKSFVEWLVVRSQHGERDAFEELVKHWQQRFYLYAFNRLNEREAARDVTQDAFLSISRSISKLKDPTTFPKWGFRIVERRCIDWQRKRVRERQVFQELNEVPDIGIETNQEAEISAETLLRKLDPRLATILRLYYLENLTVAEIAEVQSVPKGTVKSRLFYARKLMTKALEE